MNRLNLANVGDRMISRLSVVSASVTDYKLITPSLARVVATFNVVTNKAAMSAALAKALGNNASVIENSFQTVASYGNPAMVGFVSLNRETKPFEAASSKGMMALSSNMLMDQTDDSLWEVRSDGNGGKMLCRQQDRALQQLMETARVRTPRAPKLDSVLSAADPGNFVSFIDPSTDTLRYGYVVAAGLNIQANPVGGIDVDQVQEQEGVEILPLDFADPDNTSDEATGEGNRIAQRMQDEDFPVTVPASVIVATLTMNGDDKHPEVASPSNGLNPKSLVDYYGRLYKTQGPEFYKRLVEIINNHAGF